jgi:hypothetical protein
MTLKEMLYHSDGTKKTVTFSHFFDNALWYETEDHLIFPVPVSDIGTATFKAKDFSVFFMRWIRKHLELIDNSKKAEVDII